MPELAPPNAPAAQWETTVTADSPALVEGFLVETATDVWEIDDAGPAQGWFVQTKSNLDEIQIEDALGNTEVNYLKIVIAADQQIALVPVPE